MILSVRRPQYFISHTKSKRLLVTRLRLSCEKVDLHTVTHSKRELGMPVARYIVFIEKFFWCG